MKPFKPYYWSARGLETKALRRAYQLLVSKSSTESERNDGFSRLLASESQKARGIAFDYFFYRQSASRHGGANPCLERADTVLAQARAELSWPPVSDPVAERQGITRASYASALQVLLHLGDGQDVGAIEKVLRSSSEAELLLLGCMAAKRCLQKADGPDPEMPETLTGIIRNPALPLDVRLHAVYALSAQIDPAIEATLLELTSASEPRLTAAAAWGLGRYDLPKHHERLLRLVAGWPVDITYPAYEVRELLRRETDAEA